LEVAIAAFNAMYVLENPVQLQVDTPLDQAVSSA
jgi:hypothetical protein